MCLSFAFLSACQSGDPLGALRVGTQGGAGAQASDQIDAAELRAFCPSAVLRQSTSFFSTYESGGDGDPERLIHQAALGDATRSCSYDGANIRMNVAVAGRVTPGPRGTTGTVRLPIRVAVVDRNTTVYEQTYNHEVAVTDTAGATQFVFSDRNVALPMPDSPNVQVFVGFATE